jgi:uncharacterized membrane protein YeaQ/YmgE (transglycosylase-associated protein family)
MTGELLLSAVLGGLFAGWLAGILAGRGAYGVTADLTLGLAGGTVAVSIFQAVGLVDYVGLIGGIFAALLGAAGVVLLERSLRYALA